MKNNDSFKINVVSSIDDEIIDRASKERDRLLRRPKVSFRKKLIAIGSLAAMVIMVFSGILFFNSDTPKQIPIYTGMSISDTNPMLGNGTNTVEGTASSTLLSTGNSGGGFCNGDLVPNGEINKDSPFGDGRKPIDEVVSSTVTQSGKNEMYYAKPGDDIYITVHIDNPDGFEILSFTLNGKKYTSYMFEYGSDLENLILKVNVGEASGVIDYTVDQIKYIDGTEIKDVKMEGDKTVSVGIYSDNQPGAILSNRNIAINSVSFKASITDELGLIGLSNGKVQAILYDGESIVSTVDITVPNQEITFTGLKSNTLYQYAIVFIYDKLDGEGVCAYTYLTDAFYTKAPLLFDNVEVTSGGASFEYVWYNGITERVIKSASLYSGDDKVKDIPTNALSIDGLLSDTRYTLVVMYENGGVGETIKLEFETKTKAVPDIQVTSPSKSKNSISFSVSESDTDGVGSIVRVELLRGNNTVAALEGEVSGEFINLLSGTVYTIRVTYVYDLNNGDGEKTVIRTLDVTTDAKAVPDIQVTSPSKSKNSISFSVSESDTDGVGSIVRVELLRDNNTVAALEGEVSGEFINLLSGTAYTVRATYVYDLNNGEGEKTVVRILDVTTDAEPVPTINFTDYKNNGTSFSFVLSIADNPDICEILSIKMFDGDNEIATGEMGDRVEIPIPTSRKEYTVKVTYRYDLNDGAGPHTEVATISTWAPTLGLEVDNGYITGIGSCADKIIFIDKPIASDAFNGNINIEEVYILGESIGNNAFYGCIRLKYVHLADGVEILSREAFHDCVSLERINFPSGLEELGEYAFENCIGLKDIIIDPNTKINGIGDRTFIGCTSLESIFIPDSVTFIDYMAFRDCYNLKTVIFGENSRVSRIGEGAFIDCKSLESFRFPSNVIVIEKDVFSGCTSMQEVIISDEILTIKTNAFRECNALKEILIPSSVLLVESEAFIGCDSLIILVENSEIPEGWHPEWNPDGCTVAIGARINEYEFETNGGSSVDSISDYAILFSPVSRKDGFILEGWYDNPELSGSTVEFPYYSTEGTKLYAKWIELDIPNESTGLIIENGVVVGLGSCTDTVLYINKPIGELAFYDCNDIETIYLGEGVTSIGDSAFNTCDNLTTVIFISDIKPALGSDVFGGSWDNRYFGAYAPYESYDYFYNCSCEYWQEYLVGAGKLKAY